MSALTKTCLVVLHTLAVAFALFYLWLLQQHYAAMQQAALVEIQYGTAFLLLPLILPLLHLMSIAERRYNTKVAAQKARRMQSRLFLLLVLGLPLAGFLANQRLLWQLKQHGYQPCEAVHYGSRAIFTTYNKDVALCPVSSAPR
ncbi:hypothetical protein [Rheinheimera sp. NSM]|uniref:hypothetical protein n=1 Tax=Rheinheimera sp. NSM TaxID=3457884 RepID=UPI0040368007